MARGDLVVFEEFAKYIGDGSHDLENDSFKCMLIDNSTVPAAADLSPDSADYTEVTGSGYTATGVALTTTYTEVGGVATFDSSVDPSWTKTVGGPTDVYYALVYNTTHAGTNDAVAFIDMGGPVSLVDGNISITINASGIFTTTV